MSDNTKPASIENTPLEQAAAALVEAVGRLGYAAQPVYFAIGQIVFDNGAIVPVVMGHARSTLAEALADALPYSCAVAITAHVIPSGGDDPADPERAEPELPTTSKRADKNARLETVH